MIPARYVGPLDDGTYDLKINCAHTWVVEEGGQEYPKQCQIEKRYNLTQEQLQQYLEEGTGDWMDEWAKNPLCDDHQS